MRNTTGLTEALSEAEVHPFFAVELMFDPRTVIVDGETIVWPNIPLDRAW